MKTLILASSSIGTLDALEQEVQRKHTQLNHDSKDKGRFFGKQNLPLAKDSLNHYIHFIIEGYRVIYQESKRDLDKVSGEIDSAIEQLDERISQSIDKSHQLTHKLAILDKELPHDSSDYPWKVFPFVLLAVLFMLAAETGFNGMAFQIFGQNLLFSMIMAVGVSAAIMLLFHGYRKTLSIAKTSAQRWLIILGWAVFYTIVFYFLAHLRMDYLKATGSTEEISTVMFILVNWLLLLATGYVLTKCPTWEAVKHKVRQMKMEKAIADTNREKTETDTELAEMQTHRKALMKDYENMPKREKSMRDWIHSLLRQSVSDFLHENIQYRSDGNSTFSSFDVNDSLQESLHIATP
ncbi:MAG: hypothetical protein K9G46_02765 [Flavobacteriales bacterium]|nr:hypothetical protein [Flavobacteriales bacterium]